MEIKHTHSDGIHVLAVIGDFTAPNLDAATLKFIEVIESADTAGLVVDLAAASFVDSKSIGLLVKAVKSMEPKGGMLSLSRLRPELKNLLDRVQLTAFFHIHDSTEAAVEFLKEKLG